MSTTPITCDGRQARRRARIQAIRDGAYVRRCLSQGATHEYANGVHTVVYHGRRFVGSSLDEAITAAKTGRSG